VPLKIHRRRPGLNPRTLGLMASTLTVTPPRTTGLPSYGNKIDWGWLRTGLNLKPSHYTDLGTTWVWVVSVTPRLRFSAGERTPGTHCTGGWVSPEPVWTQRLEEKSFRLCRESNLHRPVVKSVARHYNELPGPLKNGVWEEFSWPRGQEVPRWCKTT
jgi:hypothetical protein